LRIAVSSSFRRRTGNGACGVTGPDLPQTSMGIAARPGPAGRCHRPHGFGDQARSLLGFPDQRGRVHQPLDDSGLVADFVQVTEPAPDIGIGNFANQRQHRRIHRVGR
jgi:hypothetical protein